MRERVEILWRLLTDDGSLWISIDDDEVRPTCACCLDEVWRSSLLYRFQRLAEAVLPRESPEAIGDVHEYVLVYAKDPVVFKAKRNLIGRTPEQMKVYRNPNNDPKGLGGPFRSPPRQGHATAEQFYEIVSAKRRCIHAGRRDAAGVTRKRLSRKPAAPKGASIPGRSGDSQPNVIRYLSEVEGVAPVRETGRGRTKKWGHTDEAKKEIHALSGAIPPSTPLNPERLMHRILQIATNWLQGELVLDSFAGSGTTAAVAHKMGRRWITVEIGEHAETLVAKRLRRVVEGQDAGGRNGNNGVEGRRGVSLLSVGPLIPREGQVGQLGREPKVQPRHKACRSRSASFYHGFRL